MSERRALAAVLVVVLITFLPTLGFGFVNWDDGIHVLDNPAVQAPLATPWRERLLTPGLGYPTPVPVAVYGLERALVGNTPWLFHATNLLVHLVSCALVFALARRLGLSAAASAFATLFFGMHPVVAESVSWVSGLKDLLVTAIALATLNACLAREEPTVAFRVLVTTGFALALACKPVAVFLVPTIPIVRALVLGRSTREGVGLVLPMLGLLAIYVPLAISGQVALGAVQRPLAPLEQARSIWYALGIHVELLGFAREPSAKHMPPSLVPPFDPGIDLAPVVLVAVLSAIALPLDERRRRAWLAACAFSVFAYAPNSNLVPLARYAADTYVYLPLVGVAIAFGIGFDRLLVALGGRALRYSVAAPIALAVFLAMLAIPASARYADSIALWEQARRVNPDEWRICRNWAVAVGARHGAAATLRAVSACSSRFGMRGLHKVRGRALLDRGRASEALAEFELAARERPDDEPLGRLLAEMRAAGIVPAAVRGESRSSPAAVDDRATVDPPESTEE